MRPCYVYLIEMDYRVGRYDMFKVGISDTPRSRHAQIITASPFKTWLVKTWKYPSRADAYAVEQSFHRDNAEHRQSGEWFLYYLAGAWCELDDAAMHFWLDRGIPIESLSPYLIDAGLDPEAIPDLICAEFGEPPYEVIAG